MIIAVKVFKVIEKMAYVQLLSGKVYEYEGEYVLELLIALSKELGIPHRCIKLFRRDQRVFHADAVVEGDTYYAFIEPETMIDRLYTRIDSGVISFYSIATEVGNAYEVVVREEEFTQDVIDHIKLVLWEDGYESHDLNLNKLIELYTEKHRNKKVMRVVYI